MVTRRGLFAGIIAAVLSFFGVRSLAERDEPAELIGTGPTATRTEDGHVLEIPGGQTVGHIESRWYVDWYWGLGGTFDWEPGTTLDFDPHRNHD